jgi:hypothetical protein
MDHLIEFRHVFQLDVAVSAKRRLERVDVQERTRAYVYLQPYVVETAVGLIEVANLCLEDGSRALQVPYQLFRFLD